MSLLAKAVTGVIDGPKITTLYGINKIGKTTFVCEFPNHILFDIEKGSNSILKANRVTMEWTYELLLQALTELLTTEHKYTTVGIDSVEALETMIHAKILRDENVASIELAYGGYGKGFTRAREMMTDVMHIAMKLRDQKKMNVFLIGHSQSKTLTDAMSDTQYEQHTLRTNDKMASVIRDLSDNIIFIGRKMMTAKKNGEEVAVTDNKPYMFTTWSKGAIAGNRSNLPAEMPLDYTTYVRALELGRTRVKPLEEVKAETAQLIEGLDKETQVKAVEQLKKAKTLEEVVAIKSRVQDIIAA